MAKFFLIAGAVNAMLAVGLGAFGAHGLKGRVSADLLVVYQTGVQYHVYHALGLILIGILALHLPASVWMKWSGGLMLAGILCFSGSLYLLAVTGIRWLGAITPLGGLAFLIAWLLLAVAVFRFEV
ncbi:MAG TPA: DUF423 domain-containing protein [Xanthomonadales bacterium]|nr:DUF423 domain-containing protein [Xanthomonadales bacterium]